MNAFFPSIHGYYAHVGAGAGTPVMGLQRDMLDQVTRAIQFEARGDGLAAALQEAHALAEVSPDHVLSSPDIPQPAQFRRGTGPGAVDLT